jgi:hypothetical protein
MQAGWSVVLTPGSAAPALSRRLVTSAPSASRLPIKGWGDDRRRYAGRVDTKAIAQSSSRYPAELSNRRRADPSRSDQSKWCVIPFAKGCPLLANRDMKGTTNTIDCKATLRGFGTTDVLQEEGHVATADRRARHRRRFHPAPAAAVRSSEFHLVSVLMLTTQNYGSPPTTFRKVTAHPNHLVSANRQALNTEPHRRALFPKCQMEHVTEGMRDTLAGSRDGTCVIRNVTPSFAAKLPPRWVKTPCRPRRVVKSHAGPTVTSRVCAERTEHRADRRVSSCVVARRCQDREPERRRESRS